MPLTTDDVESRIDFLIDTAKAFVTDARGALDSLENKWGQMSSSYNTQYPNIIKPTLAVSVTPLTVSIDEPTEPTSVDLSSLPDLVVTDVPAFNTTAPTVTLPTAPDIAVPDMPEAPTINSITVPDVPTEDIPTAPTLAGINIPDIPTLDQISFTATAPTFSTEIQMSTREFAWEEPAFVSEVKAALEEKILTDIANGGTGLGADIESDIWYRNYERDTQALADAEDKVISFWAGRGFSMPSDLVEEKLIDVRDKFNNDRLTRSREISIKQAELALANTHFTLDKALGLSELDVRRAEGVANRALDAAKSSVQLMIAIYDLHFKQYTTAIEAFRVEAMVFDTRVKAELSKLEITKAQLDAARLTGDLQTKQVEIYKAQVSAVEAVYNLYRTQVASAEAQSKAELLKLEEFKSQIEGFVAQVRARESTYGLYRAQIDGEKDKVALFSEQVRAYSGQVEAARTTASIREATYKTALDEKRLELEAYGQDIAKYRVQIDRAVSLSDHKVRKYAADISLEETEARIALAAYDADIRNAMNQVQVAIENSKLAYTKLIEQSKIDTTTATSLAQIYSQLAGSAMSAIQSTWHIGVQYSGKTQNALT